MSVIEREELKTQYREYRLLYRACIENGTYQKAKFCAKVLREIRRAFEADKRHGQDAIRAYQ